MENTRNRRNPHQSPLRAGMAFVLATCLLLLPASGMAQPTPEKPSEPTILQAVPLKARVSETITFKGDDSLQALEINLPALIKLVETGNLDIAIAKAQLYQAQGYKNQAISTLLPSIRAFSSIEKLVGGEIFIGPVPFPVDRVTYAPRIAADWSFNLGGKAFYNIKATNSQIKRVQSEKSQITQKAMLDSLTQYFTWLRDSASVETAKQALKESEAQLHYNESRHKAGFATRLDVTQSQALTAQRKAELLKAENARENSAITLAAMLNLPLTLRLELADPYLRPVTLVDETRELQTFYDAAVGNRSDIKELDYQIAEAKARLGAARADLFPNVNFSAYRRGVGPNVDQLQPTNQMMGSISIDLLKNMGWGTMSEMQVQRGRVAEAILNREKKLNDIQKSVAQAYQDTKLYKEVIVYARQKVEAAFESYKISGSRLKHGIGTNFEVVQAQKDLTDARQEFQSAVMNYNNSQLKLLFESGQLTPKFLLSSLTDAIEEERSKISMGQSPYPAVPPLTAYQKPAAETTASAKTPTVDTQQPTVSLQETAPEPSPEKTESTLSAPDGQIYLMLSPALANSTVETMIPTSLKPVASATVPLPPLPEPPPSVLPDKYRVGSLSQPPLPTLPNQ